MGSRHAASLMLAALHAGCTEDVRVTLAILDKFIPAGSTASEFERRDLLEGLGAEVIACRSADGNSSANARTACRALLEHLAQPDRARATVH